MRDNPCIDGYNLWAATYDTIDNPLVTQTAHSLAAHAALFSSASVLELGCGTGRNAKTAIAFGATAYAGIDASRSMLDIARRIDEPRLTWVEAELGSYDAASADDAPYDLVLICLVLEHFEDIAAIVNAASCALSPGGKLIALELHPSLHDGGVRANFRVDGHEIRLPSFRHVAPELEAACARASLSVLSIRDIAPTKPALADSPKLRRYVGKPVLLELIAERSLSVEHDG